MTSWIRRSVSVALTVLALAGCNPATTPSGTADGGSCPSVGGSLGAVAGATGMMVCSEVLTVSVEQTGCMLTVGLPTSAGTIYSSGTVGADGTFAGPIIVPGIGDEPGSNGRLTANFPGGTLEYRSGSPEAVVCSWTLSR